jgi:hypothetical protein
LSSIVFVENNDVSLGNYIERKKGLHDDSANYETFNSWKPFKNGDYYFRPALQI